MCSQDWEQLVCTFCYCSLVSTLIIAKGPGICRCHESLNLLFLTTFEETLWWWALYYYRGSEKEPHLPSLPRNKTKMVQAASDLVWSTHFFALFSDPKLSLPGIQFSLRWATFSDTYRCGHLHDPLFQRELDIPQPVLENGNEASQNFLQNSWLCIHSVGSTSHSSIGHIFSLLLLIPRAWVLQNPASTNLAFIFSEFLDRENARILKTVCPWPVLLSD